MDDDDDDDDDDCYRVSNTTRTDCLRAKRGGRFRSFKVKFNVKVTRAHEC